MRNTLIIVACFFVGPIVFVRAATEYTPTLHLKNGPVRGLIEPIDSTQKVEFYQGIKYATADRFEEAKEVPAWSTVYDATIPRAVCPQFGLTEAEKAMTNGANLTESEDCLYLNVWRPVEEKANRSVMFWIHGGGFEAGSIFLPFYDARQIAIAGDLIVVSIAYRLGPLGFLHGPGVPTNLGLRDQIFALNWIQGNIHAFGGNPKSVTIFGESAGSMSVGALVLSPLASGLFQRAIAQSGAPTRNSFTEDIPHALERTQILYQNLNCSHPLKIECIKGTPLEKLQTVIENDLAKNEEFLPIYGDQVLPLSPILALKAGKFNPVDFIYGTTRDEGTSFLSRYFPKLEQNNLTIASAKEYIVRWMKLYGEESIGQEVADFYLDKLVNPSQDELKIAISSVWGDSNLVCPSILFGEELARHLPSDRRIFAYRLTQTGGLDIPGFGQPEWMGVTHGADIEYLFMSQLLKDKAAKKEVSDKMISAWTTFAKTGQAGPSWSEAVNRTNKDFSTRFLNLQAGKFDMVEGFYKKVCEGFWKPKFWN